MSVEQDTRSRPDDASVQAELAKVLASNVFSRSKRMGRFLRLVVNRSGTEATALKEYEIAVEVYDRPASFDTRPDPIVRVEARRLRQKLTEYYATAGREDSIMIELPKGGYVPEIRFRNRAEPAWNPIRRFEADSRSVAVLPFLNPGGDSDKDYFVDGLPEELTAVLAQVPDLRVIARTSAFAFRGRDADVRLIGRKLNVQTVVEGSVRWSGSRLRVTVQMADCGDGCHLFAESFDVEEKELFTLQSEMAQMISDVLVPHLPERGDSPILRTPQPVQPEVYRLYLRGRYHWNRRRRADLEKAIGYCESAIAIQPDYAPAYTCIADACWVLCFDMLAPYRDLMLKAKAAAARALELDPGLAEAHVAFAAVAGVFEYQFGLAEVHVRRAIELKPSYAPAHYIHACLPALRGQTEEALAEMKTSLGLDPLSIMVNRAMVACLCEMRQFDRAVAQAKETIEFDPSFYGSYLYLGWAYMAAGKYPLALEALEQARSLGGEDRVMLGYLAASKAKLGKKDEAELILLRLLDPAPSAYVPPLVVAAAFVALEKIETAFDFLERAVEERNGSIMHLRQDPFFQPLHGMPRFDDLCRRMNLV